jgi:(4S)-4-hydroxy-5-phosphonooxypentane-2,3-dione isomerase
MYVVVVNFIAKPEAADAFRTAVLAQAKNSLANEAGCRVFDVAAPTPESSEVFLYEVYENEAAFQVHLRSAHFLDFDETTKPMTVSKDVRTYQLLSESDTP